jgi:ComEC/Rec2-related protein
MLVRRDIVAISIPFSAGVASAAILSPGGDALYLTAAGSCLAAAGLLACAAGRGRRDGAILSLFWALGVFCHCSAALAAPVRPGPWPPAQHALDGLLRAIDAAGFPHESTASLLKALLAGRREGLDRATVEAFRAAGASHILALSGLHLGILYGLLSAALRFLGRSRTGTVVRSILQVGFSAGYVVMTGASASLVRAFLFILFNELSHLLPGRRSRPLNIFCAALTVQLAVMPGEIASPGFQLSYLAMLGIVLVFPGLDAWYPRGPRPAPLRRIWSGVALALSCQLFTAPLVWIRFRQFPKYFLLTNLGAMPLAEGFICCSLPVLAAGSRCPEGMKKLADMLGQWLVQFLETVAAIP